MLNDDEHRHRYIFRLMYFVCIDKSIVKTDIKEILAYQEKQHCLHRLKTPAHTIEPMFLVPEKLGWILEPHARLFYIKDRVLPPRSKPEPIIPDPHKKYMFRLLYAVCKDKKIISANVQAIPVYQERKDCEHLIEHRTKHMAYEDKTKPLPIQTIEGFWPVPEALWWILAPYAKQFYIKDRPVLKPATALTLR